MSASLPAPDPSLMQAQRAFASGLLDAAVVAIEAALATDPTSRMALSLKAAVLTQRRHLDDAASVLHDLTRHHPADADAWLNYGHLLKTTGRIADAAAAYRQAISIAPSRGIAWWRLADLKSLRFAAGEIAAMRTALVAAASDDDRIHVHFALAKALGDQGDHAGAFEQLRAGNALRLARAPHDADSFSQGMRRAERDLTAALLAARSGAGASAPDPIFIVGMPRSGSTLVEQILASHPLIEGTEELHDLHIIAREMTAGGGAHGHLAGIADLPPARLRDLGERYLAATRPRRSTDRPFFTDKMPSNWLYTGLIPLILPNARIVDVRRHPMACGFANYAQHYGRGNDFAYDLTAIGRFHAEYVRHMAHIDRIAPGLVHRVHLEALIDDLEGEVRRLLAYLDLPFDPACLRFHETARAVHTPSTDQVRRPINRDGLDRWRAYERWLGPLAQALGPALDDYPGSGPLATGGSNSGTPSGA